MCALQTSTDNDNNNSIKLISILYFNVLTQQLLEPITKSAQVLPVRCRRHFAQHLDAHMLS
jgi:hypothetical protein